MNPSKQASGSAALTSSTWTSTLSLRVKFCFFFGLTSELKGQDQNSLLLWRVLHEIFQLALSLCDFQLSACFPSSFRSPLHFIWWIRQSFSAENLQDTPPPLFLLFLPWEREGCVSCLPVKPLSFFFFYFEHLFAFLDSFLWFFSLTASPTTSCGLEASSAPLVSALSALKQPGAALPL